MSPRGATGPGSGSRASAGGLAPGPRQHLVDTAPLPHRQRRPHRGGGRRRRHRPRSCSIDSIPPRRPAERPRRSCRCIRRCPRWRPTRCLRRAGHQPARDARGDLLPHRHRAAHPPGRRLHLAAEGDGHGRPSADLHLRAAAGDAALRPVRDDRLRQQRGRRQPRRQRPVDGRPPRRRSWPWPACRPGRRRSSAAPRTASRSASRPPGPWTPRASR